MRKLKITLIIVIVLFFVSLTTSQFVTEKPEEWYFVEDWEVEVCSKWGGRQAPAQITDTEIGLTGYGPFTYTMIGKKTKVIGSNETLYTYAYYLQSYSANIRYSFDLYNSETDNRKGIADGDLAPGNGIADQAAEYSDIDYTHIRLYHNFGQVLIPLVEEK
ncbi:hypothetical protein ACFLZN_00135 [Nanoarchaeota archaeon]